MPNAFWGTIVNTGMLEIAWTGEWPGPDAAWATPATFYVNQKLYLDVRPVVKPRMELGKPWTGKFGTRPDAATPVTKDLACTRLIDAAVVLGAWVWDSDPHQWDRTTVDTHTLVWEGSFPTNDPVGFCALVPTSRYQGFPMVHPFSVRTADGRVFGEFRVPNGTLHRLTTSGELGTPAWAGLTPDVLLDSLHTYAYGPTFTSWVSTPPSTYQMVRWPGTDEWYAMADQAEFNLPTEGEIALLGSQILNGLKDITTQQQCIVTADSDECSRRAASIYGDLARASTLMYNSRDV